MARLLRGVLNSRLVSRIIVQSTRALLWLKKVGLALLDQGLIAGSNFVLGILLARWLSAEKYGGYALACSIFAFVSQFYMSFLVEPMAVFGGSTYRARMPGYLGSLLWLHLGAAVLVVFLLGGGALGAQALGVEGHLPEALAAVMVAGPCMLLFWLVRRAFYTDLSPTSAVLGAAIYGCIILAGLLPLYWYDMLSVVAAFALMGCGALLTSVWLLCRLKPTLRRQHLSPSLSETWTQHWSYGRWALATSVLLWIPSHVYYPLVTGYHGIASAGELRVLLNFMLPIENMTAALSLLFQSYVARLYYEQGTPQIARVSWQLTLLYSLVAGVYWGLLLVFRQQVLHGLYGPKYIHLSPLMAWLALASIVQIAIAGPIMGLRAITSPASVFVAYAIAACVTVLVGIPLTAMFGLQGALWAMVPASLTCFVIGFALLQRKTKRVAVAMDLP